MSQKGKIATAERYKSTSYIAEADIDFGKGVMYGTDKERQVKVFGTGATAADFVGVAIFDPRKGRRAYDASGNPYYTRKYLQYDLAEILYEGDIWVEVGATVHAGQGASCDKGSGNFGPAGQGGNYVDLSGARFVTGATSGNLALLRLNLPQ